MSQPSPQFKRSLRFRPTRRGFALVVVLGFLVLLTGLTTAFFLNVTSESSSARGFSNQVSVNQLADSSVQTVMGQIRLATSGGTDVAWASQPGMIRTYGTASQGAPVAYYKLYSSDAMALTADLAKFDPASDLDSAWDSKTALFTDLNSPVANSDGNNVFPIIDPTAAGNSPGGTNPLVDGFSYTPGVNGVVAASSSTDTKARLPMPVKWLYVLKDGTLVGADVSSTTLATFSTATGKQPTAANPIVGRIAFWTDDETCKLNVNTASEGVYWDTPMFCTTQDIAFSLYQPATREYSRYPGHPATTSLSPVLWSFLGMKGPWDNLNAVPTTNFFDSTLDPQPQLATTATNYFPAAFSISPRNLWGGSKAGSTLTVAGGNSSNFGGIKSTDLDGDRLYASFDELVFSPPGVSATSRPANPPTNQNLTADRLSKLRFFLTANSRAPEVNPFNLPKVTMWPIPDPKGGNPVNPSMTQSPMDKTIAFCSTLNNLPYYFTRSDPTSATKDLTPRNLTVFKYLRGLLDRKVPGFGGTFGGGKWTSAQTDQILTLVFDYIRSCVNLVDSSAGSNTVLDYKYSYTTPPSTTVGQVAGSGQVVPISMPTASGNVKGIGRFPTLRGATLQFIARSSDQPPLMVYATGTFVRCPVIYGVLGNSTVQLLAENETTMNANALTNVLKGTATAKVNIMHPWTTPVTRSVSQLSYNGSPVLAVDANKLSANPNDTTAIYPVFDLSDVLTKSPPNYSISVIPTASYPTLDFATGKNGLCATLSGGVSANITVGGTKYTYYKAANLVELSPGYSPAGAAPMTGSAQTHAGLPYLTVQRANANGGKPGAFDIPNPNNADQANPSLSVAPNETVVEAALILDPVNVAPGNAGLRPDCGFKVAGLKKFKVGISPFNVQDPATETIKNGPTNGTPNPWSCAFLYGIGWPLMMSDRYTSATVAPPDQNHSFPFASGPIKTSGSNGGETFNFTGGDLIIDILPPSGSPTVQTITMNFPDGVFPMPKLTTWHPTTQFIDYPPTNIKPGDGRHPAVTNDLVPGRYLTFDRRDPKVAWSWDSNGVKSFSGNPSRLSRGGGMDFRTNYMAFPSEMNCSPNGNDPSYPWWKAGLNRITSDTFRSVEAKYGDLRLIASLPIVPSSFFTPNPYYTYSSSFLVNGWKTYMRSAHSLRTNDSLGGGATLGRLTDSQVLSRASATNPVDYPDSSRIPPLSATQQINVGDVQGLPALSTGTLHSIQQWDTSRGLDGYNGTGGFTQYPYTTPSVDFRDTSSGGFLSIWTNGGDFDNGLGMFSDGPFINKPDEGSGKVSGTFLANPYFSIDYTALGNSLFSPNRQIPSSVMLGSLPIGFGRMGSPSNPSPSMLQDSWRTLLFCPNPNAINVSARDSRVAVDGMSEAGTVPSSTKVPDYVLLDFFHMPVVEPYPISEPFSTAGKVNMNYQIAPFTYITRDTALRGVLKSSMLAAVPDRFVNQYKTRGVSTNGATFNDSKNPTTYPGGYTGLGANTGYSYFRYPVHAGETLKQFQERFTNKDLFRSPAEICSLWLYPAVQPTASNALASKDPVVNWNNTNSAIKGWWYGSGNSDPERKSLTGDNVRERPYATIYPRLTTKSNTYTVHFRVQALKKMPGSDPAQWDETKDLVAGEYRGSSMIERYVDPNDTTLPDFATNATVSLDAYYKFRVLNTKKFSPQ